MRRSGVGAPGDPKVAVRDHFDRDVHGYLGAYSAGAAGARSEIFRARRRAVLDLLGAPLGQVLDVGSGPGVFTRALLERDADCWVVDLAPEMVRVARDLMHGDPRAHRVRHAVADADGLPFRDGAFDAVLCIGVFQYLAVTTNALGELARVTRPGGRVIISFPNQRSPLNVIHRVVVGALRRARERLGRVGIELGRGESRLTFREDVPSASFRVDDIAMACRRAGLRPDAVVHLSLHFPFAIPGLGTPLRAWNRIANRVLDSGRLRTWGREIVMTTTRER